MKKRRDVRKTRRVLLLLDGVCVAAVAIGMLLRGYSRILGAVLGVGGIICLVLLSLPTGLSFLPRCPHCGGLILNRSLNGMRLRLDHCPHCGAILTDDNLIQ